MIISFMLRCTFKIRSRDRMKVEERCMLLCENAANVTIVSTWWRRDWGTEILVTQAIKRKFKIIGRSDKICYCTQPPLYPKVLYIKSALSLLFPLFPFFSFTLRSSFSRRSPNHFQSCISFAKATSPSLTITRLR